MDGKLLTRTETTVRLNSIPDMVKDENNVDIHRAEKYFTNEAWEHILDLIAKSKKKGKWIYALDVGGPSNVRTAFHVISALIGITYTAHHSITCQRKTGFADLVFLNTHRV